MFGYWLLIHMPHPTNLIIISGPSGSGQDSVIQGLIDRGLPIERVITTMARPMRAGESEGQPYYFVSPEKFDLMIKNNELIEWAEVYDSKRGVTRQELERGLARPDKIAIWKMDWKGTAAAKKLFPEAIAILITAPSIKDLIERIKKRGDSPASIQSRIAYTKEFLKHKNLYNYVVINEEGKLEQTIDEVIAILKKESYLA